MHNVWGTEFLMLMSKLYITDDEPIRLANNWSCIQAYYVLYHCTQALLIANGQTRPDNHTATQNAFCNLWAERNLALPPWSLAFGNEGAINVPNGIIIDDNVHPWSSSYGTQAWSIAAKSLQTTRSEALMEKMRQKREEKQRAEKRHWKEKEAERIAAGKKPRRQSNFDRPGTGIEGIGMVYPVDLLLNS